MRVLVAGATGVIGRQVVPLLASVGHDVIALSRTTTRTAALERSGATIVTADALDRQSVSRTVRQTAPEAIVNLLTAIPAQVNPRRLDPANIKLSNRVSIRAQRAP